jgi:hypothetical protein
MTKPLAVIAHYNKELEWTDQLVALGFDVKIYTKGLTIHDDSHAHVDGHLVNPKWIEMESNVGREAHTYAHHIIKNFDTTPDDQWTVFLQDDAPRHCPMFWEKIKPPFSGESDFHSISEMGCYTMADSLPKVCRRMSGFWAKDEPPSLKLADYYGMIFATSTPLDFTTPHVFSHGANFAVKQTAIKKAGIDIFKRILKYTEYAQHPIEATVMERFWAQVLGCA